MSDIYRQVEKGAKPRVHITYDVETGDGKERRDLPFVVGVMGDFSGDPTGKLKPMADRKFVDVTRENFDEVMAQMKPGLNLRVENTLEGDGSEIGVQLKFDNMGAFEPGSLVQQIEPLRKLMETRNKMKDLQSQVQRSPDFEEVLEETLKSSEKTKALNDQLGPAPDAPAPSGSKP